jgi:ancient ubiquitous protein 1
MDENSSVPIEKLFNRNRFPNGFKRFVLLLYCPIGVLLIVIRLFLGFHAYLVNCILPGTSFLHQCVVRILCTLLGFWITQDSVGDRNHTSRVIVANHVSPLDHTAVNLIQPCALPNVWDIPGLLSWCFGYVDLGVHRGRDTLIANAKKFCEKANSVPLLAFPEGSMTSGQYGMLRFSSWPFSLNEPVQPLLITISRPFFADISPIVLGSRWWLDIFWFLFVPYTHFHMVWLPIQRRQHSPDVEQQETPEDFSKRTQVLMCSVSNLKPTHHTSVDAVDYAKRVLLDRKVILLEQTVEPMVHHVKLVLPQVPVSVIKEDLLKTQSTDQTISNLLEGRVPYTPELVHPSTIRRKLTNVKLKENKPESWRHVYDDRKRLLMDENRQKYLVRQGLVPSAPVA